MIFFWHTMSLTLGAARNQLTRVGGARHTTAMGVYYCGQVCMGKVICFLVWKRGGVKNQVWTKMWVQKHLRQSF